MAEKFKKTLGSFKELDIAMPDARKRLFEEYQRADYAKRKEILKEYGIKYKGEYLGIYNSLTHKVIILEEKNPFTGGDIEATLREADRFIDDIHTVKVVLTGYKTGIKVRPEDAFACFLTKEMREKLLEQVFDGMPVYTKGYAAEDKRGREAEMEERNRRLRGKAEGSD